MSRVRLPDRRPHELRDFQFRGHRYTIGVGKYDDGTLAEIFIDCDKASSPVADDGRDAAICLSIALQHGVDPAVIRAAVTREENGSPSGIVGAALDLIMEGDRP